MASSPISSVTQLCPTFCDPINRSTPGLPSNTNSWSPPKPMSIKSGMPSNHLILCHPLLLMPSIFPSIRVFSSESVLRIRWPKGWSFSFSISPSNEYSGLIFWSVLNTVAWIWANQAIISHGIKQDLIIKMALSSTGCPPSCLGKLQTSSSYVGLTAVLSWVGSQWGTQFFWVTIARD